MDNKEIKQVILPLKNRIINKIIIPGDKPNDKYIDILLSIDTTNKTQIASYTAYQLASIYSKLLKRKTNIDNYEFVLIKDNKEIKLDIKKIDKTLESLIYDNISETAIDKIKKELQNKGYTLVKTDAIYDKDYTEH